MEMTFSKAAVTLSAEFNAIIGFNESDPRCFEGYTVHQKQRSGFIVKSTNLDFDNLHEIDLGTMLSQVTQAVNVGQMLNF